MRIAACSRHRCRDLFDEASQRQSGEVIEAVSFIPCGLSFWSLSSAEYVLDDDLLAHRFSSIPGEKTAAMQHDCGSAENDIRLQRFTTDQW